MTRANSSGIVSANINVQLHHPLRKLIFEQWPPETGQCAMLSQGIYLQTLRSSPAWYYGAALVTLELVVMDNVNSAARKYMPSDWASVTRCRMRTALLNLQSDEHILSCRAERTPGQRERGWGKREQKEEEGTIMIRGIHLDADVQSDDGSSARMAGS